MGHHDAHWSCEELLGTKGPGKPADTQALGKETNQTRTGGVGSGLTHDCTTPSSACLALPQGGSGSWAHPEAPTGTEGGCWLAYPGGRYKHPQPSPHPGPKRSSCLWRDRLSHPLYLGAKPRKKWSPLRLQRAVLGRNHLMSLKFGSSTCWSKGRRAPTGQAPRGERQGTGPWPSEKDPPQL